MTATWCPLCGADLAHPNDVDGHRDGCAIVAALELLADDDHDQAVRP